VFGAATQGGHLCTEIKSERETDCLTTPELHRRKKAEKAALRESLSLDKGSPHKG